VIKRPNEAFSVAVGMLSERTGLWQVTPKRVELLQQYAQKLSPHSKAVIDEMIDIASSGERFWTTTSERYIAIDELRGRTESVNKDDIDKLIAEVSMHAKRDGVAHREWVKNILDVLARISSER
jgi:hypothetical protein